MIFDSHLHIIDPRFPLMENNGYLPNEFTSQNYLDSTRPYHVKGGAIVSGSFQAFDHSYLLNALSELGPGFVGVTQVPVSIADDEICRLNRAGVRAVRFNFKRGGSENINHLEELAFRIYELANWHVELYIDSATVDEIFERLVALPKVVIDHLGLSKAGLPKLFQLVENGVSVKATGFGRIDFDPAIAISEIMSINEESLLFGTDLPSTRSPRPFQSSDINIVRQCLTEKQARKVLLENAVRLYKPSGLDL